MKRFFFFFVVLICISFSVNDVKHLLLVDHLCVFLGEISFQALCPLKILSYFFIVEL